MKNTDNALMLKKGKGGEKGREGGWECGDACNIECEGLDIEKHG